MRFISILFLLTFPLVSFAQDKTETEKKNFFKAGLLLGFNASQVDGDKLGGQFTGFNKIGLNVGATASFAVYKPIYFNMELLFNQKGSRRRPDINFPNEGYNLTLNYIDIPLYLNYRDKDNKARFGLGASYSRLFGTKEKYNFVDVPTSFETCEKRDFCWLADFTFMVKPQLGINFRYTSSIIYFRKYTTAFENLYYYMNSNQFNRQITIRAFYQF